MISCMTTSTPQPITGKTSCRTSASCSPLYGTLITWADLSKHIKRIYTGLMPVTPVDMNGIESHRADLEWGDVRGNHLGLDHDLPGPFLHTIGASTILPQVLVRIDSL